ncbi:cob(I)yrinic acid a,c-diamide adenosyltransferase [Haliscomenobacter hydrossis]|uniref:Corrinoid adenosyltransferase n=1 Tax=Haliscomenobacter hydrossis (strain ATCC 27775 / DSM 1100 / LMG 10767 / O) TaxID=760192 RepID=F4KQ38_HALH1|nr:cob(I)yrinic acid a,c-diamide adenosyltransferase [Haliscomenobacter hydrossis]AEE54199.1 ATP/cobalamin adenosyltransferase [Haliscomenobacter hydrossis DSM 1100]
MAFKIYTKTGDKGETGLFGGKRLPKYDLRIESYGTVDELNSYIGLVRDYLEEDTTRDFLKAIQDRLFTIGANLASDPDKSMSTPDLLETDVQSLEQQMDLMDETLPALKNFILPGGHPTVSFCHIARTVCRRAERQVVALAANEAVDEIVMVYLNRLSDYLFVLSRKVAKDLNVEEVSWHARK